MAKTRIEVMDAVRKYVSELERLGVPVERVILYGSYQQGRAGDESDVDLAVFSEAFGSPDYVEYSGVLSEAKWNSEPMIEAIGFHPSALDSVKPISLLNEIIRTGKTVYRRGDRARRTRLPKAAVRS